MPTPSGKPIMYNPVNVQVRLKDCVEAVASVDDRWNTPLTTTQGVGFGAVIVIQAQVNRGYMAAKRLQQRYGGNFDASAGWLVISTDDVATSGITHEVGQRIVGIQSDNDGNYEVVNYEVIDVRAESHLKRTGGAPLLLYLPWRTVPEGNATL